MKIAIYFNEKLIPFLFCICNYAKFRAVKNFGMLTLTGETNKLQLISAVKKHNDKGRYIWNL